MRATTSGGSPIAEILTLGARYDVIRPLEVALRFREPEPSTEGIAEFHEVMRNIQMIMALRPSWPIPTLMQDGRGITPCHTQTTQAT